MEKRLTGAMPRFFIILATLLLSLFLLPQTATARQATGMTPLTVLASKKGTAKNSLQVQADGTGQHSLFISTILNQKERAIKAVSNIRMLKSMSESNSQDKQKLLAHRHTFHSMHIITNNISSNTRYLKHHTRKNRYRRLQLRI